MKTMKFFGVMLVVALAFASCKKDDDSSEDTTTPTNTPKVIFKFVFDEDQERLDNFGNPSTVPAGHAAQTPVFNKISAHYLEMIQNQLTQLGEGEVLYKAPETTAGGDNAIDFDQSILVGENEAFLQVPISAIDPGTYTFLRASLAYQNYDIDFTTNILGTDYDLTGTLASFVGFNTYITDYTVNTSSLVVNDDKLQGYWGFEASVLGSNYLTSGQAPAGATTVPNPLFATSPIPAGSCVVTGEFQEPLVIIGNETSDIVVILSLSCNQSFEWVDGNANGKYEPSLGENVVDMGLRGLVPYVE